MKIKIVLLLLFITSLKCSQTVQDQNTKEADQNKDQKEKDSKPAAKKELAPAKKINITPKCHKPLMNSYNLKGFDKPQVMFVEMCPGINLSCCTKDDQLQIFGKYIQGKEQAVIKGHYFQVKQTYLKIMNHLKKVHDMAKKIVKKQKLKRIGNCKLMSERLISYDVPTFIPQLKNLFIKSEMFFTKVYDGFYCSLCNAEVHPFIDIEIKGLFFSEKFCRDIIENNLPTMLYMHRNFIKLINLSSQILASCSFTGDFNVKGFPPKNVVFKYNEKTIKKLDDAFQFRNAKNWFSYSQDVCNDFTIVKFPKIFDGQIVTASNFVIWAGKRYLEVLDQAKRNPLARILETANNQQQGQGDPNLQKKEKKKAQVFKDVILFKKSQTAKVHLEQFKISFQQQGWSMYDMGKNAQIIQSKFEQVKAVINLEKAVINGTSPSYQGVSNGTDGTKKSSFASVSKLLIGISTFFSLLI